MKIFHTHKKAPKCTKRTKKHRNAPHAQKSTTMQPSKSTKTQISEQKFKNALKKHLKWKKSNLFAYLHFFVFCTSEEKIEKRR